MDNKVVLLGATGFTGRLTAQALADLAVPTILVGRDPSRLEGLSARTGQPTACLSGGVESVRDILQAGDVLVSLVGPFVDHGPPAVTAAIDAGAHYMDSTGEHGFIAEVFAQHSTPAARRGVALLPALAADWAPGHLAAALAGADAGEDRVVSLRIVYAVTGPSFFLSKGSVRTGQRMMQDRVAGFAWRDGAMAVIGPESFDFTVAGEPRTGNHVSGTEHFALPRLLPHLRDIATYLSFPPAAPSSPGLEDADADGPTPEQRALNRQVITADACDGQGKAIAHCELHGPNGYDYSASLLAWAATAALHGSLRATGACGPVEAFGRHLFVEGNAVAGMHRVA